MSSAEQWRDIPGYEGAYQVSDLGRVRSLDRNEPRVSRLGVPFINPRKGRVLKPCTKTTGYVHVVLGKGRYHGVHRLVLLAFAGVPADTKMQGNHLNGCRSDNRLSNLEWATCGENHKHAFSVLGRKQGAHPHARTVVLKKGGTEDRQFSSASLAAKAIGASPGAIAGAALRGHKCRGNAVEYVS